MIDCSFLEFVSLCFFLKPKLNSSLKIKDYSGYFQLYLKYAGKSVVQ